MCIEALKEPDTSDLALKIAHSDCLSSRTYGKSVKFSGSDMDPVSRPRTRNKHKIIS